MNSETQKATRAHGYNPEAVSIAPSCKWCSEFSISSVNPKVEGRELSVVCRNPDTGRGAQQERFNWVSRQVQFCYETIRQRQADRWFSLAGVRPRDVEFLCPRRGRASAASCRRNKVQNDDAVRVWLVPSGGNSRTEPPVVARHGAGQQTRVGRCTVRRLGRARS